MPRSDEAPSGEGWLESADWLARARRLGPLRYSDLGPRRLGPPAAGEDELGPLAAWLAAAADRWWAAAGRPDPFTLVVASGDDGHLARAVLDRRPACGAALRYVLVDPDQPGRTEPPPAMAALVPLEEPAFLYPAAAVRPRGGTEAGGPADGAEVGELEEFDLEFGEHPPAQGIGPLCTYLAEIPGLGETDGAVVAVRLLSRLPYDLYEQRDGEVCEVRLAARPDRDGLLPLAVPADDAQTAPTVGPPTAPSASRRWRRLTGAAAWLRRVLPTATAGVVAVVDEWGAAGDTETVDVHQLRQVREPLDPEPQQVPGTRLGVVTWRLG